MPRYCMLPTRHVKLRANGCPDRWYASVLLSDASSATAYAASAVCRLIVYVWGSSCRKIQHQPVACPGQCLLQPTVHWEASSSCPCPQDSGNPKAVQPALRHGWSRSSQHAIPPVTTKASALGSCTHWPSVANRLPTTSHMRPIPQPPAGAILHGRRTIHLHTPSDRCTSARRAASPRNRCIQWDFLHPQGPAAWMVGTKGCSVGRPRCIHVADPRCDCADAPGPTQRRKSHFRLEMGGVRPTPQPRVFGCPTARTHRRTQRCAVAFAPLASTRLLARKNLRCLATPWIR